VGLGQRDECRPKPVRPVALPREREEQWAREDEERARAYRELRRIEMRLTENEMCQREAYCKLKKEVHNLATEVSRCAVLDTRSYSLWLVQVKGARGEVSASGKTSRS
jgi:DNA replication protein DnaC